MNQHSREVTGARVAHDESAVCDLEAVRRETVRDLLKDLAPIEGVEEAFALQTCHRVEAYVVTEAAETGEAALDTVGFGEDEARVMDHEESIRHLMRVAAGLESVVLGEDQVLGQVRDAYEVATDEGALGHVLEEAVLKAIRVGERARTETAINEGVTSLGSAAVDLAASEAGLEGADALVVGMGEMGTLTTLALGNSPATDVFVANRTRQRAEDIVRVHDVEATVLDLEEIATYLPDVDVLVTATAAEEPVVDEETVEGVDDLYCIDLGQPRDVAPAVGSRPGITLRDLDDITAVTEETEARRDRAAAAVRDIIDEEFDRLVTQYKRKRADDVIAAMYEGADQIKHRELQTALAKLDDAGDLTDDQRDVVESFAESLISQLLAAPTRALRDAAEDDDWSTIATAIRLFDPDFENDAGAVVDLSPETTRTDRNAGSESGDGTPAASGESSTD
ncbi:MAG: glutamyl-tRNA reductase [Halanaeroarchaeum sp.]